MKASLRTYRPTDEVAVVALSLAAWEPVFTSFREILGDDLYERVHPDWHRDQASSVRAALARNHTWVAVTDGDVIGFVNVVFNRAERSAEIYMIAVDPTAQRRGVATQLTHLALAEMSARGIDLAIVATGGDPGHAAARATYERAGFIGVPQVWYARQLTDAAAGEAREVESSATSTQLRTRSPSAPRSESAPMRSHRIGSRCRSPGLPNSVRLSP